jgi:hypothetical protein
MSEDRTNATEMDYLRKDLSKIEATQELHTANLMTIGIALEGIKALLASQSDNAREMKDHERRLLDMEVTQREAKTSRESMATNIRWLIMAMIAVLGIALTALLRR